MDALKGKELKVFLALCRAVRWQQEVLRDKGKNISATHIQVHYTHQLELYIDDMDAKQVYAIMHRLREKGFVEMKKVPTRTIYAKRRRTTVFSIGEKGMDFIQMIRKQLRHRCVGAGQ